MLTAVSDALTSLITMIGSVVTAVISDTGALNDLLPVFAIGIAASVVLLGVKIIRKIAWGA
jgi:divalent metal cation (Fe/Co/Zn/Cd) transporter